MNDDEVHSGEPATVAVCWGRPQASVIQSKLADAGVKSYVKAEALSWIYAATVDGLGRMEVQVAGVDAPRAREVLASATELPENVELSED